MRCNESDGIDGRLGNVGSASVGMLGSDIDGSNEGIVMGMVIERLGTLGSDGSAGSASVGIEGSGMLGSNAGSAMLIEMLSEGIEGMDGSDGRPSEGIAGKPQLIPESSLSGRPHRRGRTGRAVHC